MKQKIKLLHVTSSLKMGGAEAVLCDVVKGLGESEFEHHVIYFHDGPRKQTLQDLGVSLHHIRGLVYFYDPIFFVRLFRMIKKVSPDCIHSLLWAANVASRVIARLLLIPHISAYHIHIDVDGYFRKIVDKLTIHFSQEFIAVSNEVADSIEPASPISIIQNGIDVDDIQKKGRDVAVGRSELGLSEDHFVVGSVGRFASRKNYPLLLESFALLQLTHPKARLVLVGIGPDEHLLRKRAHDLNIANQVIFVVGKHAYGYFSLFDCFVQSSDKEGTSIALLEAMSFKLPCIVFNDGPIHPVITDGKDGVLVKEKGPNMLAQKIEYMAKNQTFARELGLAGNNTVRKKFSLNAMVLAYRRIILRISNSK